MNIMEMHNDCLVVDHINTYLIHGCWLDGMFHNGKLGAFNYLLREGFSMRDARQLIDALPQITGIKDGTQYPLA